MSPAAAPRPAPLARVRLQRVTVRGFASPGAEPVFHFFEEMARRSVQAPPSSGAARRVATRA